MRLRSEELKKRLGNSGLTVEQLGEAIERDGLRGGNAVSAVRNWMAGRNHPRAKVQDVTALASALGCQPKDIVRFISEIRFHRGSPKKAKLVVDLVRGRTVDEAMSLLRFSPQRAAVNVRKALDAAVADAEQAEADITQLVVSESRIDGGPHIKRFQPKDRGRAHPILKRTSHITIGVEERA